MGKSSEAARKLVDASSTVDTLQAKIISTKAAEFFDIGGPNYLELRIDKGNERFLNVQSAVLEEFQSRLDRANAQVDEAIAELLAAIKAAS